MEDNEPQRRPSTSSLVHIRSSFGRITASGGLHPTSKLYAITCFRMSGTHSFLGC
jgi:hypothetical protein